jgi:FAD dependent oxidoreductase TIGR03364
MLKNRKYDLVIVGGGIIGTFCALQALKKKKSVLLLEKDELPYEASFRNFGQAVPSGQALDTWFQYGRKSLNIYKELQKEFDISLIGNGSWYLASDDQEATLLEEMSLLMKDRNYHNQFYTANKCLEIHPHFNREYVKAGLFFPDEASLNPLVMVHRVRELLIKYFGLHYQNQCSIIHVEKKRGIAMLTSSKKQNFWGDHVILANGRDTQFLLPEHYPKDELKISKLQMMRLAPQKQLLVSNILTGLTIRRYESFHSCPSFSKLTASPEQQLLQNKGIHILFKQAQDGSIILGDSHEYLPANEQAKFGFEISSEINEMMLTEAKKITHLENWQVDSSWAGFYLQSENSEVFTKTIDNVIHIINGIGGKGMTTSPGFTAEYINQLYSF